MNQDMYRDMYRVVGNVLEGRLEYVDDPVVLVVDDSPTVRKIVQLTLQRERIHVVTAGDGLSALAAVADEQPDLILLDIMLPRMDGYNICQVVRHNMAFRDMPIIMLSGKDGLFDKMRGKLAGSTEYITKPFDSAELVQTVKRHLDSAVVRERAAQRAMLRQQKLRRHI
jgi:twitching motility two-component system response regulator PilG